MSKAGRANGCRFGTRCIAILCWAGTSGAVLAAQYDGGLGYSLSHDGNITRSSADPRAEWTEQLFGGFGYEERSSELYARLVAQVERRHFVRNTYQDDTGFFLDSTAVWTITPRQFTWSFEDVFREANLVLSSPDTPANRAKTNSLSTGPEFTFRVDPANSPVIGARYGRYYVQGGADSGLGLGDSERYAIYTRWLHQISAPTTLSLNFAATRIHFDPPALYTDLSREDLFFRYEMLLPSNRQTVDVGTTRVVQYGGQDFNGRLARYAAQLSLTSESSLRVFLSDQFSDTYSDTVQAFSISTMPAIQGEAVAAPLAVSNAAAGDVYHSRRGELTYGNRGELFGYSLQGYRRHVNYVDPLLQQQDYSEKGGRLSVSWFFSIEAQAYAFTQYMRREFSGDEQDADRNKGVGITYRLGRTLTLTLEAGQTERQSTVPLSTFVDRRAMLLLGYSTGPLYSPRSRR